MLRLFKGWLVVLGIWIVLHECWWFLMDLGGSLDLDYPRLIFVGSSGLGWFSLDLVGFFRGYGCFSGVRSFNLYIY